MKPFAVTVIALALAGCASTDSGQSVSAPVEGKWQIGRINGNAVIIEPMQTAPILTIEGEVANANFGCNQTNVAWPKTNQDFAEARVTRMMCPPQIAELERSYAMALEGANNYRIENGRLQILAGTKVVVEAFRQQSTQPFTHLDGQWDLEYLTGVTSIEATFDGRKPYLVLDMAQGKASGNSGCNQFFATVTPAGEALWLQRAGVTMMACADHLERQERTIMQYLAEADRTIEAGNALQWWQGETLLLEFSRQ